jgi:hypothetical protein
LEGNAVVANQISADDANDQLLLLNHEIRQTESHLATARRRRRQSNVSLVLGPVVLVVLYALWWIPGISRHLLVIIYVPSVLAAMFFAVATVYLKVTPGGPRQGGRIEVSPEPGS